MGRVAATILSDIMDEIIFDSPDTKCKIYFKDGTCRKIKHILYPGNINNVEIIVYSGIQGMNILFEEINKILENYKLISCEWIFYKHSDPQIETFVKKNFSRIISISSVDYGKTDGMISQSNNAQPGQSNPVSSLFQLMMKNQIEDIRKLFNESPNKPALYMGTEKSSKKLMNFVATMTSNKFTQAEVKYICEQLCKV